MGDFGADFPHSPSPGTHDQLPNGDNKLQTRQGIERLSGGRNMFKQGDTTH